MTLAHPIWNLGDQPMSISLNRLVCSFILLPILLCAAPNPAIAQITGDTISSRSALNTQQLSEVKRFVENQLTDLVDTDAKTARNAKRQLLSPLTRRNASRPFRIAYADQAVQPIAEIINSESSPIHARLAGLHVLGALAADLVMDPISEAIQSDVDAIRYNAAIAYQRTYQQILDEQHAFTDERLIQRESLRLLESHISNEENPLVLHALIAAAVNAPDSRLAIDTVCSGIMQQFKAQHQGSLPQDLYQRYDKGLQDCLNRYIGMLGTSTDLANTQKALVESAVMAIQLAIEHSTDSDLTDTNRAAMIDLTNTSENILDNLCGDETVSISSKIITKAITRGDVADAQQQLLQVWLRPNGPIFSRSTGLDFKPDHFDNILDK